MTDAAPDHIQEETTQSIAPPERPPLLRLDERMELRTHVDVFNALDDAFAAVARGVDFFWAHGGEGEGDDDVAHSLLDAAHAVEAARTEVERLIETRFPGQTRLSR